MNTRPDTTPAETAADQHDLIRSRQADVDDTLLDLLTVAVLVEGLIDTYQRGLGFLTPAGRQAADAAITAERAARIDTTRRDTGLGWMRGTPAAVGTGQINTAGNANAISTSAEISFALQHAARRLRRDLERAGVCAIARPHLEPDLFQLVDYVRALVQASHTHDLLTETYRDLRRVVEGATLVVDGNDRTQLGDCPHCGLPTLVVYFNTGVIRCDRDPRTGHYAPCVCPDSYCDCKRKPVSHRHEWRRDQNTGPNGWWTLSDRLALTRTTKEP